LVVAVLLAALGCAPARDDDPAPAAPTAPTAPAAPTAPTAPASSPDPAGPSGRHVVAISVDGLSVSAVRALGRRGAPTLDRLLREGASTLNARSAYEQNVTLPNHAGMVTGRRIDAARGGHGVTWNHDAPDDTVQAAAGEEVPSIFTVAHEHGLATALFSGKAKFDIFADSWPKAIDEVAILDDPEELVAAATDHLRAQQPDLTFLHLDPPDAAGHASGGMSPAYLDAVRLVDRLIGEVLATIDGTPPLADATTVVLTADHGFRRGAREHGAHEPQNYTVPFLVWGAGIAPGDLYERNRDRRDPGAGRPSYDGPQPIRNRDLAAATMQALGLPPVQPGDARLAW